MQESSSPVAAITCLLDPVLETLGYELVRVKLTAGGRYQTLQLMAERLDGKPMTVQDCVAISHAASEGLERRGPSSDSYTLEVSAPGVDRPLVRVEDFERFAGRTAVVEMQAPVGGHKRFLGRIMRVRKRKQEAEVELSTASGPVHVPVRSITEAHLSGAPEPLPANDEAESQ